MHILKLFITPALAVWITQFSTSCSLNIDDPAKDLFDRIGAENEITPASLLGKWRADSLLKPGGRDIQSITPVSFEMLRDATFAWKDPDDRLFTNGSHGTIEITGQGLVFSSDAPASTVVSFAARLTYLGQRLALLEDSSGQTYYFEKVAPDSQWSLSSFLSGADSSLWEIRDWRQSSGALGRADFVSEFIYLRFWPDSAHFQISRGGLTTSATHGWTRQSDSLLFPSVPAAYNLDILSNDSLRLWPLSGDSALVPSEISGTSENIKYYHFKRVATFHPHFRDLNFLMTYWRSDTLNQALSHYGRYYDLEFLADGTLLTYTNIDSLPQFSGWEYSGGNFRLHNQSTQPETYLLSVEEYGMSLQGPSLSGYFSAVDPQTFADDPLKRFSDRSYVHLSFEGDTLRFYFDQAYRSQSQVDQVQLTMQDSSAAGQVAWTVLPGTTDSRLIHSSDSAFVFGFNLQKNGSASRLYFSDTSGAPGNVLSIRAQRVGTSEIVTGTLTSGSVINDSGEVFPVSGHFRYNRSSIGLFDQSFWDQIPKK